MKLLATPQQLRLFEETAGADPGWWEALWPSPDRVIAALGVRPGDHVADVCCGDGWFTQAIAAIASHVTAIDLDPEALSLARLRLVERGQTNCSFCQADAYDTADSVREPADYVLLANVFHGVPDRTRLLHAMWHTLRPGGLLGIVDWHARPRETTTVLGLPRGPASHLRIGPVPTVEIVEARGFAIRDFVDVSPHHYGVVFEREAG